MLLMDKNKILRRIFEPKREQVTGGWRKVHNEELHNVYCSPDIMSISDSHSGGYEKLYLLGYNAT
jgi:hypothetical protein